MARIRFPQPIQFRGRRTRRLLAQRAVAEALISVAGLVRRPLTTDQGERLGRIRDVTARWDGSPYPAVIGVVARVGWRRAFVPAFQISEISHEVVRLSSARLDLRDFIRREGEVLLVADVIDHQLVDVDGVRVIRASDLYLARVGDTYRLVGADVSLDSLFRRLGPARYRTRPKPDRVIDWAAIQPFGGPGAPLTLRESAHALRRLRPAELADMLEDLGHGQRRELLSALGPEVGADALEEMDRDDLVTLLEESPIEDVIRPLSAMEPDEAVDALREVDDERREELLSALSSEQSRELRTLLSRPADVAGGLMTPRLVTVEPTTTVGEARVRLREEVPHQTDVAGVLVVEADGKLIDDISVFELCVADPDARIGSLVGPPWPVTVSVDAPVEDVVEAFLANRGSSLVVLDDNDCPVGRIVADDVIDALTSRPHRALLSAGGE